MGTTLRKLMISLAVAAFAGAWMGVAITWLSTEGIGAFTVAVTIAALATEVLIWVLAIAGGWTVFANRKRLWSRLTGRGSA
ncbi:hypothetical protein [Maricaulis sp.]|uniref:hypothetical protein n=1 Tax=Maricaulis sp. TaxID=1486257 RepID=UPI002629C605|nr:hypothetical protein [Maricaulis sp.]